MTKTRRSWVASVALFVVVAVAPARADTAPVQERLVITPLAPARVGDELTAILHLHNASAAPATTDVTLTVDGESHVSQRVIVPAQTHLPVPLRLYLDQPGSYTVSVGSLSTRFELFPADISLAHQFDAARGRTRRVIYNNDGGDAIYHHDIHTLLDVSTSGLAGSHVDTISYCTVGGLTFWHDSRVGQVIGRGVVEALKKSWNTDALNVQADFARRHGMEIFWSMRMNDTHDRVEQWRWLMPQWKRDHPHYLVGDADTTYEWGAQGWTALDYNHAEARDYIFEIIEDVAKRYAVDGIELDFYRGEPFFKEQLLGEPVSEVQRNRMTDLVRRLAAVMARESRKRNRPLLLAVRVPDSLAYCRDIGLDVERWLKEAFVDVLIVGGDHRYEPWENMVRLGHQYDRPVYACLAGDYLTQEETDWEARWRGHALHAWRSGIDGIYTFNFLQHRHALMRQMGNPATLEATETVYQFTPGTYWGFLKGEMDYIHAVRIEPAGGPFVGEETVTIDFPPRKDQDIYYTLDGSEPTRASRRYDQPIAVDDDATVKARSYAPDGTSTPVMGRTYRRVTARYRSTDAVAPLNFFGLPNGAELSASFDVPPLEEGSEPMLFLSMMDVDSQQEAAIYVNGNGPLWPPVEVLSGAMTLDGYLPVPVAMVQPGRNVVTFKFDNLNEGTSGFCVYRVEMVVNGPE